MDFIRENVQRNLDSKFPHDDIEMSTDDLISILIWIIIEASHNYLDIPADIRYVLKFHFVSSSTSHLGFILCNFQVALMWFVNQVKQLVIFALFFHLPILTI
jgi:hypothetical protein